MFIGKENLVYEAAGEAGNTEIIYEIEKEYKNQVSTYSGTYVTTPNGSKVDVDIYSYNGDTWAKALDAEIKKEYPDATLIRSSDNRYKLYAT